MYDILFEAMSDRTRRNILEILKRGPRSVGELADALPVTQPAVSQHLKVLRETGLVRVERDGVRRIHHLRPEGFAPLRAYVESFWEGALERFRRSFESPID